MCGETKRRAEFLAGKVCHRCGIPGNLEVHHRDPKDKISHRIWGWSKERRDKELAKCEILCRRCHHRETLRYRAELPEEQRMQGSNGYILGYNRSWQSNGSGVTPLE